MANVLINGVNWAWGSLQCIAFGVPVTGITAINYKIKQEKTLNYGAGLEPVSVGFGNISYDEGSITVYRDWWQSVINASPEKSPLKIAPFDWTILFGIDAVNPTAETLKNVMFLEDGLDANQGDTKLLITIPFKFAGIKR